MDRSSVLAVSLQSIKAEFGASDTQLGLLTGIAFAVFFSTMGIPIAAWADRSSRRNVLAVSIAVWSGMTALCGMALNFGMLFATRVGTAIGEAGGTPPSHSLISDYFPKTERGRAFAIFALGVPFGTALGSFVAGQAVQAYGWRTTFVLVGLPGLLVSALVALTIKEPPRGLSDHGGALRQAGSVPGLFEAMTVLWRRPSFRHLCLASALHAVVWYASSAFNAAFLIRSHQMTAATAANWLTLFAAVGGLGTLAGGYLADRLSVRTNDKRWYLWVPGIATLGIVPFQLTAYLSSGLTPTLEVLCRHDVPVGGVLRTHHHDDAGAGHAADAVGGQLADAVRADHDRLRARSACGRHDQRPARARLRYAVATLCAGNRRRGERVGRRALRTGHPNVESGPRARRRAVPGRHRHCRRDARPGEGLTVVTSMIEIVLRFELVHNRITRLS